MSGVASVTSLEAKADRCQCGHVRANHYGPCRYCICGQFALGRLQLRPARGPEAKLQTYHGEPLYDLSFDGPMGMAPENCVMCGESIDRGAAKGFWANSDGRFRVLHAEHIPHWTRPR